MQRAGRQKRHQSHDAGIKQVNHDIIGVALNELRLFKSLDSFIRFVPFLGIDSFKWSLFLISSPVACSPA